MDSTGIDRGLKNGGNNNFVSSVPLFLILLEDAKSKVNEG